MVKNYKQKLISLFCIQQVKQILFALIKNLASLSDRFDTLFQAFIIISQFRYILLLQNLAKRKFSLSQRSRTLRIIAKAAISRVVTAVVQPRVVRFLLLFALTRAIIHILFKLSKVLLHFNDADSAIDFRGKILAFPQNHLLFISA